MSSLPWLLAVVISCCDIGGNSGLLRPTLRLRDGAPPSPQSEHRLCTVVMTLCCWSGGGKSEAVIFDPRCQCAMSSLPWSHTVVKHQLCAVVMTLCCRSGGCESKAVSCRPKHRLCTVVMTLCRRSGSGESKAVSCRPLMSMCNVVTAVVAHCRDKLL